METPGEMSFIEKLMKGLIGRRRLGRRLRRTRLGRWRLAAVGAAALLVLAVALLSWNTSRAVRQARASIQADSTIPITVRPVDRAQPAGVEAIGFAPVFRDAALFHGHLFLAGPQGLAEYDADGALVRRFRAGFELPPAGVTSVAVGVLATASEPELLIGTAGEGLLIFDGRRLRQMRPERAALRKLTAILPIGAGRLLLGTDKLGLFVYDGRQMTRAHPALANVSVTVLAGTEGDVWIGTIDSGVLRWRAGDVRAFDESAGLPDPRVLSIAVAGDRAYIGTALGVAEIGDGRPIRTLGPGLFASALAVRHDTLMVGTLDEAVARIPLDARSSRGVRPLVSDVPGAIQRFVDADGVLYALAEDALYAVEDRTSGLRRVIAADPAQLTDRNVSALALDRVGRLWVGYFDRGLDILDATGERASHVENDRVFCVNRILHAADGGMTAVATANGLVLFDAAGRQKQVIGRAEGLIANHVTDVILDAGHMTVATPAGLTFIDPAGARSLYAFHGLVNNHVYALGGSGTQIIAGTLGGVSMLENGADPRQLHDRQFGADPQLDHRDCTGRRGVVHRHLWRRGVRARCPGPQSAVCRSRRTDRDQSECDGRDRHACVCRHVVQGSARLRPSDPALDDVPTGLPSLNVTAIATDADALYVGTDNGIVRISRPALRLP